MNFGFVPALLVCASTAALPAAAVAGAPALLAQSTPAATDVRYAAPRIVEPKNAETIRDNNGVVTIRVTLTPALRSKDGHRFRAVLDGTVLPGAWSTPRFSLQQVDRGAHALQVIVADADGNRIAESAPIEFHMWRASRLFPSRRGGG